LIELINLENEIKRRGLMFLKLKTKVSEDSSNKGFWYFFQDRAQFEKCVMSGCKLISIKNAFEDSEFTFFMDFISSIAIEIWRLEKRVQKEKEDMAKGEPLEFSLIVNQMQRIKDVFKKQEIETREPTGENYNDGLSLKVLHVEEMDGIPIGKMQIIETIKPSVYLKGKVIFPGEVIVGKAKENKKE
jgi:hypothetical protein